MVVQRSVCQLLFSISHSRGLTKRKLTDVQPNDVHEFFAKAANVDASTVVIDTSREKPYALLTFRSVDDARRAYDTVDRGTPLAILHQRLPQIEYTTLTRLRAQNGRIAASIKAAKEGGFAVVDVPGLYVINEFVTEREESELLAAINQQPWNALQYRRVQHYGYEFDYKVNGVNVDRPLSTAKPSFFDMPLDRIAQQIPRLVPFRCDQLTINE